MKGTSLSYAQAAKSGDSDKSSSPVEPQLTEQTPILNLEVPQIQHIPIFHQQQQYYYPTQQTQYFAQSQFYPQNLTLNKDIEQIKAMVANKQQRKVIKIVSVS
jgi:hypothetical protein